MYVPTVGERGPDAKGLRIEAEDEEDRVGRTVQRKMWSEGAKDILFRTLQEVRSTKTASAVSDDSGKRERCTVQRRVLRPWLC